MIFKVIILFQAIFFCASNYLLAQKKEWITYDSLKKSDEKNWSICGYYGWNTSFFNVKPLRERGFASYNNIGLDVKRQFRKNVFLCLVSRYRTDVYFLENSRFTVQVPLFDVSNFEMTQRYSIHSHAFTLEYRAVFKKFNLLFAGGMGMNFINTASKNTGNSGPITDTIVSATSNFGIGQSGYNYFGICNVGAEVPLFKKLYAYYNFSATYDFNQFYPILPFVVATKDQSYILAPIPRKLNLYLQLGLSFKF